MRSRLSLSSIGYIESAIFLLLWLLILLSPLLNRGEANNLEWVELQTHWIRMAPFVLLSVLNHFLLVPFLFFRKKKSWYLLSILCMVALLFFVSSRMPLTATASITHPQPGHKMMPPERANPGSNPPYRLPAPPQSAHGMFPPRINFLLIAMLALGFDTGLRTAFRWTKTDQERLILERENMENQLAALRNQVNPHFFMNTLNNIHALIDIDSSGAKEAVIRLSQLMRHLLYDSNEELSPLEKEVEFVQSYIDLMRIRFSDKVEIALEHPAEIPQVSIPPLLFTSLLENAFKHGISYSTRSYVHTIISPSASNLYFEIRNRKIDRKTDNDLRGIGIENTRKRLDLLYGNRHNLDIVENEDEFVVKVTIPL